MMMLISVHAPTHTSMQNIIQQVSGKSRKNDDLSWFIKNKSLISVKIDMGQA
jgi:hypothetical protein